MKDEIASENAMVSANCRYRIPVVPGKSATGTNTAISTSVVGSKGLIRNRETVTEWEPEHRMVVAVDQIEKQPIKQATMTFTLSVDGGATRFSMSYDYEPQGGPLALVCGPILDRLLAKGFNDFIDDLGPAARAWSRVLVGKLP